MPETGGGVGKSDEFYAIIRQISNRDWPQFARGESYLNLPQNVIDDIQFDQRDHIVEQKYQMLLKWEQRLGWEATVESLKEKANRFLGKPANETAPASSATQSQHQSNQGQPNNLDRESLRFRTLLMNISMSINVADLSRLTVLSGVQRQFSSAHDFLFHLEDNNLWFFGDRCPISEKLNHLKENLNAIQRNDLTMLIDDSQRAFTDNNARAGNQVPGNAIQHQENSNNLNNSNNSHNELVEDDQSRSRTSESTSIAGYLEESLILNRSGVDNEFVTSEEPSAGIIPFMDDEVSQESDCRTSPSRTGNHALFRDLCTFEGTSVSVRPSTSEFFHEKTSESNTHEVYKVSKFKGNALIISNVDFPCWGPNYYRHGGENNCDLMENLFGKTGLGLNTIVKKDLKAQEMRRTLEDFSQRVDHELASMCVVLIMSHGQRVKDKYNGICGTDGEIINAREVLRLFDNDNCSRLINKPKMFFFQFCRGHTADRGVHCDRGDSSYPGRQLPRFEMRKDAVDESPGKHLPRRSDMLVVYSTQEDDLSFRSWLTNALANVFSTRAHDQHVCEMLNEVKRGFREKVSQADNPSHDRCKAMPDIHDALVKHVYFFPGFP